MIFGVETVLVTMPVHPYCGHELAVVRTERGTRGKIHILVEAPDKRLLRLPIDWTNRGTQVTPVNIGNKSLVVNVRDLLFLAKICEAATKHVFDQTVKLQTSSEPPQGRTGMANGFCCNGVGGAPGGKQKESDINVVFIGTEADPCRIIGGNQ